jgi:hypothetical protein
MNPPSSKSEQQPLNSGIHEISPAHPDGSNFWYESIDHNGQSPFIPNGATWKVFRNVVTDYAADNTGGSDATKAITNAITGLSLTRTFRSVNSQICARWLHIGFQSYQQQPGYYRPASGCVSSRWHIYHQLAFAALRWHCIDGKPTQPGNNQGQQ